jgi:hypothetical protein
VVPTSSAGRADGRARELLPALIYHSSRGAAPAFASSRELVARLWNAGLCEPVIWVADPCVPRHPPSLGPRGPGCSGRWGPCAQVAILGRVTKMLCIAEPGGRLSGSDRPLRWPIGCSSVGTCDPTSAADSFIRLLRTASAIGMTSLVSLFTPHRKSGPGLRPGPKM